MRYLLLVSASMEAMFAAEPLIYGVPLDMITSCGKYSS